MKNFPDYRQLDAMDCGPTALRMVAKHYGRNYSLQFLREKAFITRRGVSMLGISDAAEFIGFRSSGIRISLNRLVEEVSLPAILHWNQNHFVVCYKITQKRGNTLFHIADPSSGHIVYKEDEFKRCWISSNVNGEDTGTALLLEPGTDFYDNDDEKKDAKKSLRYFFRYLTPYKKGFIQLILAMITATHSAISFTILALRA